MVYEDFMTVARRIPNVQVDQSSAVWLSGSPRFCKPKQWSASPRQGPVGVNARLFGSGLARE